MALVAAAQVAPIGYPALKSMFNAAQIPLMKKRNFLALSKYYLWPTIEKAYFMSNLDLLNELPNRVNVSLDGQFDSPGFSADHCAVTAIEESTKKVVCFATIQKREVENISGRMELEGVKRCIVSLEPHVKLESITVDKNPQVCAWLKTTGHKYFFDPWHKLKTVKKEVRTMLKELKDLEEKRILTDLAKRFIIHVYYCVEKSNGNPDLCREMIFSYFLHIQGIHNWEERDFAELIGVEEGTKVGPRFYQEKFSTIFKCPHLDEEPRPNQIDTHHDVVESKSIPYQIMLSVAGKTPFMNDIERLRHGNMTSMVENFHSVCIKYRSKRLYFPKKGFEVRTMLAALDFNATQMAEKNDERRISGVYEYFSKPKGGMVTRVKKFPVNESWKKKLVCDAIELKIEQGMGNPIAEVHDDDDDEYEFYRQPIEDLLNFDFTDEEDEDDPRYYTCPVCSEVWNPRGGHMVACDTCKYWHHWFCVGFKDDLPKDTSWVCDPCLFNR